MLLQTQEMVVEEGRPALETLGTIILKNGSKHGSVLQR